MESVYSVLTNSNSKRLIDWLNDRRCVSSISNGNLLAFTSFTDIKEQNQKNVCTHVYVCDLNLPSEPYLVTNHNEDITSIEWDISGTRILMADAFGTVEFWAMKDNLIREWYQLNTFSCFIGERILSSVWFHNGLKTVIDPEKREISASYTEKFTTAKFVASVRHFGGKPATGCLCISNSGLVCAVVIPSDGSLIASSKMLAYFRSRLKAVDICYAKNGDFLVVSSNGSIESSINCYQVTVKMNPSINQNENKCQISCQPFASFYLNFPSSSGGNYTQVTHIRFVLREAADAVLVAASGPSGSVVELWELKEKPVILHKMFKKDGIPGTMGTNLINPGADGAGLKTFFWQHHASSIYKENIAALSTPRSSLYETGQTSATYIVIAYKDNAIKCFSRDNLRLVCSVNLAATVTTRTVTKLGVQVKVPQVVDVNRIVDMQFSPSGCVLTAIDITSQIFLYRLQPLNDSSRSYSQNFLQTMFEYCLVTGNDWWDLIVCTRPTIIDPLCDALSESFNMKQSPDIQQKYSNRFLAIKASLYRCLSGGSSGFNGQVRAGDCYAHIMLNAIANLLKSIVRPKISADKEWPTKTLSNIIQNISTAELTQASNIDKVLIKIESTEFIVEANILLSLQSLNQWVGDLALFLLASIPQQYHNHQRFPGGGLISDVRSVNTLRELLVIIRTWSLLKEGCLPVFNRLTKDTDVVALIFRLLTKTVVCISSEPDEMLIDECCNLPNQVLIPQMDLTLKAIGIASPALFSNTLPLQMTFYGDVSFLKSNIKTHTVDGAVVYENRRMDVVRHISLGSANEKENLRCCSRCNSMSLIQSFLKTNATRSWDQRWDAHCVCGGHWR